MALRKLKLALIIFFSLGVSVAFANSGGPSPGYTGAPGESTCRQCHTTNQLNDGVGSIVIEGVPATYEPGANYTITVRVQRQDRARWGFQMSALDPALNQAGAFSILEASRTQIKTDNGQQYVSHKTAGTNAGQPDGASWTVKWTAPAVSIGVVTFYAAGNAANNNSAQTGDNIYTTFVESAPAVAVPPFEDKTAAAGLAAAEGGGAVAWADFDLDGDHDFLVVRNGRDLLYRNTGTAFVETGATLGLDAGDDSRAAAWGDYDNDGRPDLLVATVSGAKLYRNTSSGFVETTLDAEIPDLGGAAFGSWLDADGDGDLDLLIGFDAGVRLLDNGGGAFSDATTAAAIPTIAGSRAAACADYDDDGRIDILVISAGAPALLHQNADGTFSDLASTAGIAGAADGRDAVWADYDGDADLDLFTASTSGVKLFRNTRGAFADVTSSTGLQGVAGDALAVDDSDGDGQLDVLVSEPGGIRVMRFEAPAYVDATAESGISPIDGNASTWADYDGDGHVDLLIVSSTGLKLWRSPYAMATVTVRALTDGDNDATDATTSTDRDAMGATVRLDDNNNFATGAQQVRVISGGGSTSQPPARAVFSLPFGGTVGVRATFADGEGREVTVASGTAVRVTLTDPTAPHIDSVSYKLKNGVDKLICNGSGFLTDVEHLEVNGVAMDTTKYPKAKRLGDGTSTRLQGTDSSFSTMVPKGVSVRVTTFNKDTGVRSAPLIFTR